MLPEFIHPWLTIVVVICTFGVLQFRKNVPLDLLFLVALLSVTFAGVLTPEQALAGFANSAVITIACLVAITAGLRKCGLLDWLGRKLLGDVHTERKCLWRMAVSLICCSAFLLNTAIVAMIGPVLVGWCRRTGISPSRVLIPLSYLTILGGICTLIGTSTNLVVNAKLQQLHAERLALLDDAPPEQLESAKQIANAVRPMSFLEIGAVGFPIALIGGGLIMLLAPFLMPKNEDLIERLDDRRREYLVEMLVNPECHLIGQKVRDAGLRHLTGLFLIEIDRNNEIITPVRPDDEIHANDRLVFAGVISTIVELERIKGLVPAVDDFYVADPKRRERRCLTEVVLSRSSPIIRRTLKEADFRQRYNAAVVAIHRGGERIATKLGDAVLRTGDTLLLQTQHNFQEHWRNSEDFFLVSSIQQYEPPRNDKARLAGIIFTCGMGWLIGSSFFPALAKTAVGSPATVSLLMIGLFVIFRCMTMSDVRRAVDIQLLLTIACALGLGESLYRSGAAEMIATGIVSGVSDNPWLLLVAVYVICVVLTEMLTNTAVAALMTPLAIGIAETADVSARPFIMAVAIGSSMSFMTPIGYQTNLMVMGPGGYRPVDFFRLGLPLSLVCGTSAVFLIPRIWPL